jgi:hypothetical protein
VLEEKLDEARKRRMQSEERAYEIRKQILKMRGQGKESQKRK